MFSLNNCRRGSILWNRGEFLEETFFLLTQNLNSNQYCKNVKLDDYVIKLIHLVCYLYQHTDQNLYYIIFTTRYSAPSYNQVILPRHAENQDHVFIFSNYVSIEVTELFPGL